MASKAVGPKAAAEVYKGQAQNCAGMCAVMGDPMALSRSAQSMKWKRFCLACPDVNSVYEDLVLKVSQHCSPRKALQDFRDKFKADDGSFVFNSTTKVHVEEYAKTNRWKYVPMTRDQIAPRYHSETVADNICEWLRERGMVEFSEMHKMELFSVPLNELEIMSSARKAKTDKKGAGQTPLDPVMHMTDGMPLALCDTSPSTASGSGMTTDEQTPSSKAGRAHKKEHDEVDAQSTYLKGKRKSDPEDERGANKEGPKKNTQHRHPYPNNKTLRGWKTGTKTARTVTRRVPRRTATRGQPTTRMSKSPKRVPRRPATNRVPRRTLTRRTAMTVTRRVSRTRKTARGQTQTRDWGDKVSEEDSNNKGESAVHKEDTRKANQQA